jgi:hypothetical protein
LLGPLWTSVPDGQPIRRQVGRPGPAVAGD